LRKPKNFRALGEAYLIELILFWACARARIDYLSLRLLLFSCL
jgi:hypothetical protein